jgi:hypothetical protein
MAQKSLYNRTMKETMVRIEPQLDNRKEYTKFVVYTTMGWGTGKSIKEAKKNYQRANPRNGRIFRYNAKLVTEETTLDSAGGINYFPTTPPIELGEV